VTLIASLSAAKWVIAAVCSLMVGLTKNGLPALSTLIVPLFAEVLPARASTGALLPLFILGDAFAVLYYRRSAAWTHLVKLLPWAIAGIVIGYLLMGRVDDKLMRPILGAVVLLMLAGSLWWDLSTRGKAGVPTAMWFAAVMGLLAGATTMVANAAGPVMMIYLLSMRLPKKEFIGTSAWFFFIVNWIKVPFSVSLGLITAQSLLLDAVLAGGVITGAVAGIFIVRRIPEKAFALVMQGLTLAAAIRLFF
jgi:uncharacterized membrane protein YfcA